jgi:hypothetical protein
MSIYVVQPTSFVICFMHASISLPLQFFPFILP